MTTPRLEIDLDKIRHNAQTLVDRLADRGISVTGVTKATLGSIEIARVLLGAGVEALGDSRIENIERMRSAGIDELTVLIRSPMLSQAERVVASADTSLNTEIAVVRRLSRAAERNGRMHGVVLMVELGDLREGIMPHDLIDAVRQTLLLPSILFKGIGANLACRSGVIPAAANMAVLSDLADSIESRVGVAVECVSGGNSANLEWALGGGDVRRINNLRLGESILLGRDPLHRQPISGLYTDAVTLYAEVIESNRKPSQPWGDLAQSAFEEEATVVDRGEINQAIIAVGRQDIDPEGLCPTTGACVLSASSDHLVVTSRHGRFEIGEELAFGINYSALVRAMTSPFVETVYRTADPVAPPNEPCTPKLSIGSSNDPSAGCRSTTDRWFAARRIQ